LNQVSIYREKKITNFGEKIKKNKFICIEIIELKDKMSLKSREPVACCHVA
jgi:hypothetical protein